MVLSPASAVKAPNDPDYPKQYGPAQIGALDAWTKSTGQGVIAAVVDTGVDVDHPDLKSKLVKGYDFGDGDDNPDDDSPATYDPGNGKQQPVRGHGTHVAGTIAAATNNGVGVAGVAPDTKIMPLKLSDKQGLGNFTVSVPQAIKYAVDNGAKVINLSIGALSVTGLIGILETPCSDAFNRGSLCVIAAGNSGADKSSGYDKNLNALIVTANDKDGKHAAFGQKADTKWSVSAPGVAVFNTWPVEDGSYKEIQGTSMAAPHATGVAALLFAQGLNNRQVVERMLATANAIGDPATNGAGIIDAARALDVPRSEVEAAPTTTTSRTNSSVLLPKAATRTPTTTTPRAAAGGGGGGGAAPAPTTAAPAPEGGGAAAPPPAAEEDFAADLVSGESPAESADGADGKADSGAGDLGRYTVMTIAGLLLLSTSFSTITQLRRRRSA
jgi:subtilisin family serine protease